MANEDDDLELKRADAGALFRAEMATSNFVMGYWKAIVAAIVAVLLVIFFYGQYSSMVASEQRRAAGQIATIEAGIGAPIIQLAPALEAGAVDAEALVTAGRELAAVALGTSGVARVEADLKAAELFRVTGKAEERRAVLEDALPHAEGVLAYAAAGALANLDLEVGQVDAAVSRWRALADREQGFLQEQALLELGLTLESAGRVDEAKQVYADFLTKFASSPRAEKARQRSARLGAG